MLTDLAQVHTVHTAGREAEKSVFTNGSNCSYKSKRRAMAISSNNKLYDNDTRNIKNSESQRSINSIPCNSSSKSGI